jgi:hypothetical protein
MRDWALMWRCNWLRGWRDDQALIKPVCRTQALILRAGMNVTA